MKRLLVLLMTCAALLFPQSIRADDEIDYTINSYEGVLRIHEDNSATFEQVVTYSYDSSFNGQYVTLGVAGNMPDDFGITGEPLVQVEKNGQSVADAETLLEDMGDGYRLKIYNGGYSGDWVEISVIWRLENMTFPYQDVAELNWKPISDWDQSIDKVTFTVVTDKATKKSQLWGHRGYFKATPEVYYDNAGSYTLTAHDVDGVLELHAYWDNSILSPSVTRLSGKALPRIKKTEGAIEKKSQLLILFFGSAVPIGVLVLMLFQVWRFISVKKELDLYAPKLGATRLYEVPEDLPPLVLARDVYHVRFKELTDAPKDGNLRFDNTVQAVLLDLLDRGVLTLANNQAEPSLTIENLDKTTSSDLAFLNMAFGSKLTLPLSRLFDDFQYDKDTTKRLRKQFSGSKLEKEVRKSSQAVQGLINSRVSDIDKAVKKEIEKLTLPAIYRKLTTQESRKLQTASGLGCLLAVMTGGISFYFMVKGHIFLLLYMFMTLVIIGLTAILTRLSKPYTELGVVTADGAHRLEQWQSFRRMIKEINTFKAVELEGLVVWNRLLVYAALFGYADKVEKYLRVNHIRLPEQFENLDLRILRHQMLLSTNHFVTTSNNASVASNFSVSSGGSSGSGGFSGGGGGGGGGSF